MPRSSPQNEHIASTSLGSYGVTASGGLNLASRDPTKRPENAQSSATTLPPVASLTGYNASAPQSAASTDIGSPVSFRPLGLHSMLNPSAEMELSRPAQRISQSPGRTAGQAYMAHQTPIISPRVRKRKDETSPGRASQSSLDGRQGRRMLTPKSPSLRSMSQGMRGSPSATSKVSSLQSEGRVYTAEQSDISAGSIPPLPPMSMTPQNQYAPVQQHDNHTNSSVSYSVNNRGYTGSPSSPSNYVERDNASPFRSTLSDSVSRGPPTQQSMTGQDGQNRSTPRAYGAGQTGYQMQISTDQGPVAIPVEIDLQQASKSADEKRKRNAGASARFRQRRKEKEQASSAHIADLQRELRNLTEQRDFYRSERNFFRDTLARTSGNQLPARPPSPHSRSGTSQMVIAPPESLPNVDYGRRDTTEPSPAQRRRTSDYQPSFVPAPLAPTNYPPTYAAQNPGYGLPPPSLPAPMQDPRSQASGSFMPAHHPQHQAPPPPGNLRSQPQPQAQDPFRRDLNTR